MVTNILDYLEQTASRLPDKTALADDKLSLTFRQWIQQAESIGTAIAQVTNGTIRRAVLVFVDRRIEGLVGAMGAVESGNFYVPIDCKMPFERVRLIADVCKPIAAVATTEADMNILDGKVEFIFVGTAFLKYQIRRMMGLLIDIGRGYYKKDKILEVLEKKDPSISHRVIEPTGLYLYKVTY